MAGTVDDEGASVAGEPGEGEVGFSHLVSRGEEDGGGGGNVRAGMVDVGSKESTSRQACAVARLWFPEGMLDRVLDGNGPKGPIEEVARVAGIQAAKGTSGLIPLCHPLGLDWVDVSFQRDGEHLLEIHCTTRCQGRTGVEMEAMVGASVAALTVYDMVKGVSRVVRIERVELLSKSGGRSGFWKAPGS